MKYSDNIKTLQILYKEKGLENSFDKDNDYLEKAFVNIQNLWLRNFSQIERIKYILIAEAPLWGVEKKYVYNPETSNSQFFYRSDLSDILNRSINDKMEFIQCCNEIGLIVLDISSFALNSVDTKINYKQLSPREYRRLVEATLPTYFEKKIEMVSMKKTTNIQVFFRYSRVKKAFQQLISPMLISRSLIVEQNGIGDISQTGGGINKQMLAKIIGNCGR